MCQHAYSRRALASILFPYAILFTPGLLDGYIMVFTNASSSTFCLADFYISPKMCIAFVLSLLTFNLLTTSDGMWAAWRPYLIPGVRETTCTWRLSRLLMACIRNCTNNLPFSFLEGRMCLWCYHQEKNTGFSHIVENNKFIFQVLEMSLN